MIKEFFEGCFEGEGITIDLWQEEVWVLLAMWNFYTTDDKRTFWERLKWAWRLIWKNEIYGDQILLDRETAIALGESLIKRAKEMKESK